jgi:hypothetical protein
MSLKLLMNGLKILNYSREENAQNQHCFVKKNDHNYNKRLLLLRTSVRSDKLNLIGDN